MGKELKGITAKEARELADSSDFTLKHIYKEIRTHATENSTSMEWCTYDLSRPALDGAKLRLKEDGFNVKEDKENHILSISW